MRIGITYDLREEYLRKGYGEEETAEFDSIETIEAIDGALMSLGHETCRIGGIRSLASRLTEGQRWDLVFNIAEGLNGLGREAQVPALLDAYEIPYTFSDPLVLALTLHKGMTKRVVRDMGVPTPDFVVAEAESDLAGLQHGSAVIAKPVAGGSSMGISRASKICSHEELAAVCRNLWNRFRQPVLVESFLPGREFTVGIVGTDSCARALGVMEIMLNEEAEPEIYSYANKREYETRVRYSTADDDIATRAAEMALRVWRGLGCRDAGRVDLRCDASGDPNFLEVNPLAGLHPEHSDIVILSRRLGMRYQELIQAILESAEQRMPRAFRRN